MAARDIRGRSIPPYVRNRGIDLVPSCCSYIARVAVIGAAVGIGIVALGVGFGYSAVEVTAASALFALFVGAVAAVGSRDVALGRASAAHGQQEALATLALIRTSTDDTREAVVHCAHELEEHHAHTQGELVRLRRLLDDAIAKLRAGFGALHELSLRQRGFVQPALAAASSATDVGDAAQLLVDLDANAAEFDRHVRAVVTALQFEDLAAQLIDSAQARIEEARHFTAAVASAATALEHAAAASPAIDRRGVPPLFEAPTRRVESIRPALRDSSVHATEIAAGDVELFDGAEASTPESKS